MTKVEFINLLVAIGGIFGIWNIFLAAISNTSNFSSAIIYRAIPAVCGLALVILAIVWFVH